MTHQLLEMQANVPGLELWFFDALSVCVLSVSEAAAGLA